jgi:hypothetical protein
MKLKLSEVKKIIREEIIKSLIEREQKTQEKK